MSTSFGKLRSLVAPPPQPIDAEGDWITCETELGLRLPADYKRYIGIYGRGYWSAFDIPSPFTMVVPWKKAPLTSREWWVDWAGIYQDWSKTPRQMPYPAFPAIPGLLPWGIYADMDVLSWYTQGAPEQWPLIYFGREEGFLEIPQMGFAEFLVAAVEGTAPLPASVLDPDLPRLFTPY